MYFCMYKYIKIYIKPLQKSNLSSDINFDLKIKIEDK